MVIRSYRRVFKVERRLYTIGDWQIPVPNGIPLRGFAYALAAFLASLLILYTPGIGLAFGVLPWPARHVLLPLWIAAAGMAFHPDGRRADAFVVTAAAFYTRGLRARLRRRPLDWSGKVRVLWDASDTRLHHARVGGPALVHFRTPVEVNERWDGRYAEGHGPLARQRAVEVPADHSLKVRP